MRRNFRVTVDVPEGASLDDVALYIKEAVQGWKDGLDSSDPMFNLDASRVMVGEKKSFDYQALEGYFDDHIEDLADLFESIPEPNQVMHLGSPKKDLLKFDIHRNDTVLKLSLDVTKDKGLGWEWYVDGKKKNHGNGSIKTEVSKIEALYVD